MSEGKKDEVLTGDLKSLADAKSVHNRAVNRVWLLAASVTLFVISARVLEDNTVRFLGFMMDGDALYPMSTIILSLLNIAYCSAHIQAYKMTKILQSYLMDNDLYHKKFAGSYTMADVAHSLYTTMVFRSFNLVMEIPYSLKVYFYLIIKIFSEFLFFSIPLIGMIVSFLKISGENYYYLYPIACVSIFISILSTLLLIHVSLRFTFQNFKRLSEEKSASEGLA